MFPQRSKRVDKIIDFLTYQAVAAVAVIFILPTDLAYQMCFERDVLPSGRNQEARNKNCFMFFLKAKDQALFIS